MFNIWSYLSSPLPRYMVIKQRIQNLFFLLNLNFKICKWILRFKKKTNDRKGYILSFFFFLPTCMFDLEHTVWRKNSSKYNNLLIIIALVLIRNKLFRKSGSVLWFQIIFFNMVQLAFRIHGIANVFILFSSLHLHIWHLNSGYFYRDRLSCNGSFLFSYCLGPMSVQTIHTV